MLSILKNFKFFRVLAPVAAGTTDQKTSGVDCSGSETVLFCLGLGTITSTATITVKLQGSDIDVDANYVDLASPSSAAIADSESSKLVLMECVKPQFRYIRLYIDLGTANTVINLCIAMTGNFPRNAPLTQPSEVSHYGNVSAVSPVSA